MSTTDIKQRLIDRITLIDDEQVLTEVYRLLEWTHSNPAAVTLTPELQAALDAGLDDSANDRTVPHEQAKLEIDEWLSA